MQICICARNFKFFILFIFYTVGQLVTLGSSLLLLEYSFSNQVIRREVGPGITLSIIFYVLASILCILLIIFMCESPCFESNYATNEKTIQRLKQIYVAHDVNYKNYGRKRLFCDYYFGSTWNALRWLLPI